MKDRDKTKAHLLKALEESESKYRNLHDTMAQGVIYRDTNGELISINPAAERILGQKAKQIKTIEDIKNRVKQIHEDGSDYPVEEHPVFLSLRTGQPVNNQVMGIFNKQEGDFRWVNVNAVPQFRSGEDKPYQVFITFDDITKHKQIEEELRKLSTISENTFFGADIATPEGEYTYVNESFARMHGYTQDEIVGMHFSSLFTGKSLEYARQQRDSLLKEGDIFTFEIDRLRKDGSTFPSITSGALVRDSKGNPLFTSGIIVDITERKQAEEELKRNKEYLETLNNSLSEVIVTVDIPDNIDDRAVRYVNKAVENIFGYKQEELLGKSPVAQYASKEDFINSNKILKSAISRGTKVIHREQLLKKKSGETFPAELTTTFLRKGGKVRQIISIVRDITERKKAEEEQILSLKIIKRLNTGGAQEKIIHDILVLVKEFSGCDAVGIRLQEREDFPYYDTNGFVEGHVPVENRLCALDQKGEIIRDSQGNPVLECMCGNIICGRFDSRKPFFSEGGSFWTNSTTELLASTTEEDRLARTRNRCNEEGYESVALIPLNSDGGTIGLLQLNDMQRNHFTAEIIRFYEGIGESIGIALTRQRAEEKINHLNLTLRSIRDVNQLITREKDRDKLLKQACEILAENPGCRNVWIALLDESGAFVTATEAGLGKDFLPMYEKLRRGDLPDCVTRVMAQSGVVVIADPSSVCADCPLAAIHRDSGRMVVRLEHDGKVYGALTICTSLDIIADDEEIKLFQEITGDIAFALHDIELEEERQQAEYNLGERVKELRCLYGIALITGRPDITLDEVYQEVTNMIPPGWQYPDITCARVIIDSKEFVTPDYRETAWMQTSDIIVDDQRIGAVEVLYLEEKPEETEGPFLKEERDLIDGIAHQIAGFIERKRAEELLLESEQNFRNSLDSFPLGIRIVTARGDLLYVNKAMLYIYGYSNVEELRNTPTKQRYTPESYDEHQKRKELRKLGKHVPSDYEISILRKDGEIRSLLIHRKEVIWNGETRFQVLYQDITERKKMQEQLMTNDRLASIGELVAGVAHELNNPLTGVIGFSDLLASREDLPDDIKEDIKIINREAQRTANIVKNLLTFARKQPKEKQPTDINKAIETVLELRAYEQKVNNIQVNTQFTSDLPDIMANSFDLQQVFLNIIVNAENAMLEAHGRGSFTITTERDDDIIRASFADDGPGIARENIGHLFDPFFTTKEVGKGTGLGLSISYGIITEHGGRIYAESEPGKGATFIVELPVSRE